MTDDRGLAALAERLSRALAVTDDAGSDADDWRGSEYVDRLTLAILGEQGVFLPGCDVVVAAIHGSDIAHLRALLAAGTLGPWFTHPHDVPGEPFPWSSSVFCTGGVQDAVPRLLVARADSPDAALIAEAVNALPDLLDELEWLREQLKR